MSNPFPTLGDLKIGDLLEEVEFGNMFVIIDKIWPHEHSRMTLHVLIFRKGQPPTTKMWYQRQDNDPLPAYFKHHPL